MPTAIDGLPWAPWTILVPLIGSMLVILVGGRRVVFVGIASVFVTALFAGGALMRLARVGPERHSVGGWEAPLGIELAIDGWGVGFVALTSIVSTAIAMYAAHSLQDEVLRTRFWSLFLILLGGLNALFLSGDLFNLYVTLEIVGVSAAGLTALERKREALQAALRYLLLSIVGSFSYLTAVVLIYREHATLDLALLAVRSTETPLAAMTVALMTAGLILKAALFPLHTWLPPAHSSAPASVSALLSGLVVKASFFVLLRVSLATWPALWGEPMALVLGLLGSVAVFWGYGQALRSTRLKTMFAYSTVAQTGQLFLVFPLAAAGSDVAVGGVLLLAASHALAKSAAFLGAGNVVRATGRDHLEDLAACAPRMPMTQATFAFAALSLIGLPPSAAFLGKWLLFEAAMTTHQWIWPGVLIAGTLLCAALMLRIFESTLGQRSETTSPMAGVPTGCEWPPLALAIMAAVLGALGGPILALTQQVSGPAAHLVGAK